MPGYPSLRFIYFTWTPHRRNFHVLLRKDKERIGIFSGASKRGAEKMEGELDLYAESDGNFDNFGQDQMTDGVNQDNQVDGLYDDVIGGDVPMGSHSHKIGDNGEHGGENEDGGFQHGGSGGGSQSSGGGRRSYTIIIGNLTWWTSEQDLQDLMEGYGVHDLQEIRIHENRANGQSKGFAMITVGSEETSKFLQSEIPKKDLQGQNPVCVPWSRQALNTFDAQARKNEGGSRGGMGMMGGGPGMGMMDQRRDGGGDRRNMDQDRRMDGGPMRPGLAGPGGMNPGMMPNAMGGGPNRPPGMGGMRMPPGFPPRMGMPGMPGMPRFPMGMPGAMGMRGIPPFMPGMRNPMMMNPMMRPDGAMGMGEWNPAGAAAAFGFPGAMARMQMAAAAGLPAPHINPAFMAGQMGAAAAMQSQDFGGGNGNGDMGASTMIGGEDFEGTVTQMKTVAANAIGRAAAECKTDPTGALRKLEAALSTIQTSKVVDDERVQRTLKSLQEAIDDMGMAKASDTRNGDRHSRDRSRDRDHRASDRDRDRDRHRDDRDRDDRSHRDRDRRRSRSRSPRDRKRSTDPDRNRDRERDRDRERRSDRDKGERRDSDRERDRHR
ncbi:putative Cleavage and polyadenylation specificity factor subunit 6 [Hypsibius exemplaris]|uniref:Cleavage and polyadenylation specificity factor subunit 6 n=1 Tax=Hypsibius exemplaris TaxID=2072580 RepID=A0A1W0WU89_HYPEX|nr:putative Cleavage and polyadenylation specificity factor subunit 6 [Hypsibius exemplaris]